MARVHVIHENDEWTAPLVHALDRRGVPHEEWHLARGSLDLSRPPPAGIFYSRMSASSHTRGHRYAPELAAGVLAWLEGHGARVLNGSGALRLELSKVAQYAALERHGVRTPRTVAALGREAILSAARAFDGPVITKHNRAGKGLGVRLFRTRDELAAYLDGDAFEPSVDGITLVQHYVEAPDARITRVEFVGRALLYAVSVDASGGFELCPADACEPHAAACPAAPGSAPRFEIVEGFDHPLVPAYRSVLDAHGVDVAAFEFVTDRAGVAYTYDVNTNTNYNPEAEARAGVSGMEALARFLGRELARATAQAAPARAWAARRTRASRHVM